MKIQEESEDWDMTKGMIISIVTVTQVSITFRDKKNENTRMGTNIEHVFFGTVSKCPFSSVQFIPIYFLRSPGSTGL